MDEGIAVLGSIERLRRLITTLLDNACKYAGDNGKARVELHAQNGNACLVVHNTGSLIPAEDLQHVFDRFYRADKHAPKRCRRLRPGAFHRKGSRRRAWRHDNREEQRRRGHHLHSNPADRVIEYLKSSFPGEIPTWKAVVFSSRSPFTIYGNNACVFAHYFEK